MSANDVAARVAEVQGLIADAAQVAGRSPSDITLLAVSKKQPADRVLAAYEAGLRDFGENYVQGLEEHRALLPSDARWHFIGHLQSKKANRVTDVALLHCLDSQKLATKLSNACTRPLPCLIGVNISEEANKSGIAPGELIATLRAMAGLPNLEIRGLMCIPNPEEEARRAFARLRGLRDQAETELGIVLPELSMGMSGDFAEAIEEGSTVIRVGTRLFGPRPPQG